MHVTASYKPAYIYGGPIMSVSMLTEQLTVAGHSTDVFTTTANGKKELDVEIQTPLLIDGVNVTFYERITKDHTHFSPALLSAIWRKAKEYDVIHIHAWWNLVSVLSCLLAIMQKVPVLVSPRGTLSNYSFNNRNHIVKALIHQLLTKPLLKKCFIHTTSDYEYHAAQKLINARGFFNIPNFIRLGQHNDTKVIETKCCLKLIFFSRIEEKKGLDMLLDALIQVQVPFQLTIAGGGDNIYINKLKAKAVENKINDSIIWLGFQGENKFDLLFGHDVLVLPSYDENFGNVVIESLSVGTAVLISENVGLSTFVRENDIGWICQTNPASIAKLINDIFVQGEKLVRIRHNAPTLIEHVFSNEQLISEYITMYKKCLVPEKR